MIATSRTLVLASTSPFRRMLLERLGVDFVSFSPEVDESRLPEETADRLVMRLSEAKARSGAAGYPEALIIGSDQVAVCGKHILGKPGDHARACEQLAFLSGKQVSFYTGLCLYDAASDTSKVELVPYYVTFRHLNAEQIDRYLRAEQPYNCAGSFKSEGYGITLFSALEGRDPNALVGLPLILLIEMLGREGIVLP